MGDPPLNQPNYTGSSVSAVGGSGGVAEWGSSPTAPRALPSYNASGHAAPGSISSPGYASVAGSPAPASQYVVSSGALSLADALPTAADQPIFEPGAKDVPIAIFFVLHALVMTVLAFALGVPAMGKNINATPATASTAPFVSVSLVVRMLILSTCIAAFVSVAYFAILQRYGGAIIRCSLITSVVVQFTGAAIMFAFAPAAGAVLLLAALGTALYAYWVRARIAFAAANLATAVDAVRAHRGSLLAVAAVLLAAQVLWVFIWAAAAFGMADAVAASLGGSTAASTFIAVLFLFSLFWGMQTLKNAMHFVTASAVGNWWFLGNVPSAVGGSLYRAFVTNLGSIALASLITAALRTIEVIMNAAERRAEARGNFLTLCVAACASAVLRCARAAAEYFNKWALVYSALTGSNYTHAGSEVSNLFRRRGWTAIINDDLTSAAMFITCLCIGAISGLVGGGAAFALLADTPDGRAANASIVAVFAFFAGTAMASVMTGIVSSAVTTVFVCFALNPAALGATHPNHLGSLVTAWQQAHGADFEGCGYVNAYSGGGAGGGGGGGMGGSGFAAVPVMPAFGSEQRWL
jgi:hypothetical protein